MNNQIIDPMCTLIKLIQLNFMEENTKLSVQNHVLTLHYISNYQWIVRSFNGDSRNNIGELYNPIMRLIKWYIIDKRKVASNELLNIGIIDGSSDNTQNNNQNNTPNEPNINEGDDDILNSKEQIDVDINNVDDSEDEYSVRETKSLEMINDSLNKQENYTKSTSLTINNIVPKNTKKNKEYKLIKNNVHFRKLVSYLIDALIKLQGTYKEGLAVLSLQYYINCIRFALDGKFEYNMLPNVLNDGQNMNNLLDYNKIKNLWNINDLEYICKLYDECFIIDATNNIAPELKKAYILGKLKNIETILSINENKFRLLVNNSMRG